MDRENTPGRRRQEQGDDRYRPGRPRTGRGTAMGAYDRVDGTPAYVIADPDTDGEWMAVPVGLELDVREWI